MKCNAKVIYYKKADKKDNKRIFTTIEPTADDEKIQWIINQFNKKTLDKIELYSSNGIMYECQGNIKASIGCHDEPYYGGTSAELDVDFQCDTCGHKYYPNLPEGEFALNEWINNILNKME